MANLDTLPSVAAPLATRRLLTKALRQDGATEAAWSTVKEARAIAENTGERWYEAELHRLTGELVWSEDEASTAEAISALPPPWAPDTPE